MKVCAAILGITLFKKFDFETFRFEKPALAVVYMIGLAISLYFIFGNPKGLSKK